MTSTTMKRIALVVGPGTLPSQGSERMDLTHYNVRFSGKARLSGHEMLQALPEASRFAEIEVDLSEPLAIATYEDLRQLALHLQTILDRPEINGLVWVQGTNTLEETAFFLHLTLKTRKPVALVASQRPFTSISTDAHLNLINAVRVAACSDAEGLGVVVVTNNEINSARDVVKTSTFQLQTFTSRGLGFLGYADADKVIFYRSPTRLHTMQSKFPCTEIERLPKVEILYVHTGADSRLARAALDLGSEGLVIAGIGAGALGVYSAELRAIVREGIPVVRSSRVGEGRVLATGNAHEEGTIGADNLNPQKAALLLSLALTQTKDPALIQEMFETY